MTVRCPCFILNDFHTRHSSSSLRIARIAGWQLDSACLMHLVERALKFNIKEKTYTN